MSRRAETNNDVQNFLKPKLLAIELWQVGDLAIAATFLRKASEQFDVTLLAQPFARDLQARFLPQIKVIPFQVPWTVFGFKDKYRLTKWPWKALSGLIQQLQQERFDVAVSGRWDPRDHLLMKLSGARKRVSFPRAGSRIFLNQPLQTPDPEQHRYEYWRTIGRSLGINMPAQDQVMLSPRPGGRIIVVHTGARHPIRIWPLERYHSIVKRLRAENHSVRVICNPEQRDWWVRAGESDVTTPTTITSLLDLMEDGGAFIGNDSGPGHLAAFLGIPTFTLFGPQVPNWFVPLHPAAVYVEGKPCPYKPCSDCCRFPRPHCILDITEAEVWAKLRKFVSRHIPIASPPRVLESV